MYTTRNKRYVTEVWFRDVKGLDQIYALYEEQKVRYWSVV